MKKKSFYNEELEKTSEYTEIWKYETVKVKDLSDLVVRNHYWKDETGELWLDFNDPNENFRNIFDTYRKRKGFMEPNKIKELRNKLDLSLRDFARNLGISYAKLSQIENNKRIQTLSQEISFRKAQQDYECQGYLTTYLSNDDTGDMLTRALEKKETINLKNNRSFYSQKAVQRVISFDMNEIVGGTA